MDPKKINKFVTFAALAAVILLSSCSSLPVVASVNTTGNALAVSNPVPAADQPAVVPVSAFQPAEKSPVTSNTVSDTQPVQEAVKESASPDSNFISLSEFAGAVQDGTDQIKGLYSKDLMSLRVVQQPDGNNGYVSSVSGVATQFRPASQNDSVGMLAHNFAAGTFFAKAQTGNEISVIYGNGTIKTYKVAEIHRYQALQPNSTSSSFVDLDTHAKLSATSLFNTIYGGKTHLTLQTCIAQGDVDSWGRLFVIAYPVD
jgi:hypothetical protein